MDTILALSSGRPPAAIAVLRLSGPDALRAAKRLAGDLPRARRAGLRGLHDVEGRLLDRALVLVFPGPDSATGEDLVEFHCHGGRAVVAAVEGALLACTGVRSAVAGEFTRLALLNGRIDLAQAEGLADLLEAETEGQRRAALSASEGQVSRAVGGWLTRIAAIAAEVEASLDFAEEGDVVGEVDLYRRAQADTAMLRAEISAVLAAPPVERLRDGIRIVIAGPPNSGKSTLLNLMTEQEAAIVSPHAGTTRDRIEVPVQRDGIAYLLTDTAGLHDALDPVERIGVARAEQALAAADMILWLGDEPPPRPDAIWIHSRADLVGREIIPFGRTASVRQDRRDLVDALWTLVDQRARLLLPLPDDLALKRAQRDQCQQAVDHLDLDADIVIAAEQLRSASNILGAILGIDAAEAMLDALFAQFCIGK